MGEDHGDDLREHAVAYINSDSNARAILAPRDRTRWKKMMNEVVRDIQDPETKLSVWKRQQLGAIASANTPEERRTHATAPTCAWARSARVGLWGVLAARRHSVSRHWL